MSAAGGPVGRRELAYRLFAAEYDDADLEYSASDEERAPNYVVTPTGARVNRLFVVGVLTEVESVTDEVLRARVVDPTGAFVVYAGQYQPDAVAFLESAEVPSFVAVTGKARTFRPDGSDRTFTSVRPESMTAVDGPTRDRWTVQAAEHTLARVATMARAIDRPERGDDLSRALRAEGVTPGLADGVALAIDHYATTSGYLSALREVAVGAAAVVAGNRDAAPTLDCAPADGGPVVGDLTAAPAVAGTLTEPTAPSASSVEPAPPADSPSEPDATPAVADGELADTDTAVDATGDEAPSGDGEPGEADAEGGPTEGDAAPAAGEPADGEPADGEPVAGEPIEVDVEDADADPADVEPPESPVEEAAASADEDTAPASGDATDDLGDFDVEPADGAADAETAVSGPIDDEPYDLPAAEREATEAAFGTEFSTGREVGEPGEAGIATETAPPATEAEPSSAASDATDDDAAPAADADAAAAESPEPSDAGADPALEADAAMEAEPPAEGDESVEAEPADLEAAAVAAMASLDGGDGADRAAVVARVVDEHSASAEAVEAAITEALLGGLCYEPADGRLKAI